MSPIIDIRGLTKAYPGRSTPAVEGITFTVAQGEIFGLLGPNGAGKTTLISMLSCLLAPSSGTALIEGQDIVASPAAAKRLIGLVPQDLALYPTLSTRQNLAYFGSLYGLAGRALAEAVDNALVMVRLEDRAHDRVEALSGGMKRRANIAAGLLHKPRVLFLDEPTVGVDPQSRNFIFEGVEALKRDGLTVIYTTHYMEEAERLCDRLAIIDRGRMIALDSPTNMIKSHDGSLIMEVDGNAENAAGAICDVGGVKTLTRDGARLTIAAQSPAAILPLLLERVAAAGCKVRSIDILHGNLEAVFLDLTGRRLRE